VTVRFLELTDILEIHRSRIELYGGSTGLRDFGMLQSAIAQPQAGFGERYLHVDVYEMAAVYWYHIAKNHAFIDGNKRTALAACLVFLDFNNINIDVDPYKLEEFTIALAEGKVDKAEAAAFLRQSAQIVDG
jgi:death-on-curing protein